MPRSPFHAPNFYAGVPLDRADRLRGDAERLAALLHDPQCRVVPLWRNQHLIAAEAEAVVLRLADLEGLLESPPPEWGEAIFLGLREEVAYVAIDFSRLEEPQIGPLTAGR
ncbi:MAG TPA: hypothetical protein VIR45_13780, partial [Kiloniellaceae bacterium]